MPAATGPAAMPAVAKVLPQGPLPVGKIGGPSAAATKAEPSRAAVASAAFKATPEAAGHKNALASMAKAVATTSQQLDHLISMKTQAEGAGDAEAVQYYSQRLTNLQAAAVNDIGALGDRYKVATAEEKEASEAVCVLVRQKEVVKQTLDRAEAQVLELSDRFKKLEVQVVTASDRQAALREQMQAAYKDFTAGNSQYSLGRLLHSRIYHDPRSPLALAPICIQLLQGVVNGCPGLAALVQGAPLPAVGLHPTKTGKGKGSAPTNWDESVRAGYGEPPQPPEPAPGLVVEDATPGYSPNP